MRYLLILAILLFSSLSFAEDNGLTSDEKLADLIFSSTRNFKLEQFQSLTPKEFNLFKETIFEKIKEDRMCSVISYDDAPHVFFKKHDLSGDGVDDVILSSCCGAEEIKNFIWIRKGDSLEFAGFFEGTLLKFYRNKESEPFSIVASAGWCCAGYVGSISRYKLKADQGHFLYLPDEKAMVFSGVTIPEEKIKSVRFKVTQNIYRLRYSPKIIDDLDEGMSSLTQETVYGNIIAEYVKDSVGEAVAEYKDKTGRVWWFVLMDKDAKVTANHFYADAGGRKTGWMDSRYVETIK